MSVIFKYNLISDLGYKLYPFEVYCFFSFIDTSFFLKKQNMSVFKWNGTVTLLAPEHCSPIRGSGLIILIDKRK